MRPSFKSIGTLTDADIAVLSHANFVDPFELLLVDQAILPKRLNLPPLQVADLLLSIAKGCYMHPCTVPDPRTVISTGDGEIDTLLGGGIHTGVLTEVCGESASGKTQMMLQLSTMVQIPRKHGGLQGGVAYLSSEGNLRTERLGEISAAVRQRLAISDTMDVMKNIHFLACNDSEALEHALAYALPPLIQRCKHSAPNSDTLPIRLIILDSLTALFRGDVLDSNSSRHNYSQRSSTFCTISEGLKTLAVANDLAVVAVNQVSDTFPPLAISSIFDENQRLDFEHQERFFSGQSNTLHKKPALGLVWSSCINIRLMLSRTGRRRALHDEKHNRLEGSQLIRRLALVFSPFAAEGKLDFLVTSSGIEAVKSSRHSSDHLSADPVSREITDDLGGLGRAGLDIDLPEDFWDYHPSSDREEQ